MSDPESNPAEGNPIDTPETVDWKASYEDLSRQTALLRIAVLVGSLVFTAFLYVQWARVKADADSYEAEIKKIATQANQEGQGIQLILSKLVEYSHAHPEFLPVLAKHNIRPIATNRPPNAPTLALPPTTPPTPTTPPKK